MGDEFSTAEAPELRVKLTGTAPFAKVHIIKDNKYVYSTEPGTRKSVPLAGQRAAARQDQLLLRPGRAAGWRTSLGVSILDHIHREIADASFTYYSHACLAASTRFAQVQDRVGVRILLGVTDHESKRWDGSLSARGAQIAEIEPWRIDTGDAVSGNTWEALASRGAISRRNVLRSG